MRLKVGQHCKKGDPLALSRAGNIRRFKDGDSPLGFAQTDLRRGGYARCDDHERGWWKGEGVVDPDLTAISASYLPPQNIPSSLFTKAKK